MDAQRRIVRGMVNDLSPVWRSAVDPEVAMALEDQPFGPLLDVDSIRQMREALRPVSEETLSGLQDNEAVVVTDYRADRPDGTGVPLLVLRPTDLVAAAPVLLFFHGGGLVAGDATTGVETALEWAIRLGVLVVSVDYRLAPEHPYPAAVDDCFAALRWVAEHGAEIGGDPSHLVLVGFSAGGGLAAATALRARDSGGPQIAAQLLAYPMLDDRPKYPSSTELVGEAVWDSTSNRTAWTAYLGDRVTTDLVSSYAAPARADDLRGLPPAYLDVGTVDTFRDEVLDFGARLAQAAVPTELHLWPGAFHGSEAAVPEAMISRATQRVRTEWLERTLLRLT